LKKKFEKKKRKKKEKLKKNKKKKKKKKERKKKRRITVDYCCNPQCFVCEGTINPPHNLVY
jgi:hypothetical protein